MQLDNLRWEMDRLKAENVRLQSEKPEQATIADVMMEVEEYKLENDWLASELGGLKSELLRGKLDSELQLQESSALVEAQRQATETELAETVERCKELDALCTNLHDETKIREQAELERL